MKREKAISKLNDLCEDIGNHILKCVVYGGSLNCWSHWVDDELGTRFYYIDDIEVKTKNRRLRYQDYKSYIFDDYMNELSDAKSNLVEFYIKQVLKNKEYPEFEISDELCKKFFSIFCQIRDTFCPIFAGKTRLEKEEVQKLLHDILDNLV